MIAVALVVRERRDALGLSQHELAEKSGLNRSYIGDFERGGRSISIKNLSRLAQALEVSASKIVLLAEKKMSSSALFDLKPRWSHKEYRD